MNDQRIIQGACWLVLVVCLLALALLLDVYRIERRAGAKCSMAGAVFIATALLTVTALFAKCTWLGHFPVFP